MLILLALVLKLIRYLHISLSLLQTHVFQIERRERAREKILSSVFAIYIFIYAKLYIIYEKKTLQNENRKHMSKRERRKCSTKVKEEECACMYSIKGRRECFDC